MNNNNASHTPPCQEFFSALPLIFFKLGADEKITYVSKNSRQIMGYSPEELIGRSWRDLLHPDDLKLAMGNLSELAMNKKTNRHEFRVRTKDKKYKWMWFEGRLSWKDNKIIGLIAYAHDISHVKTAEHDLVQREAQYRSLFENTTLGFYRTTPEGKILMINPAAMRILGFASVEEFLNYDLENNRFQPEYDRLWFKQTLQKEGFIKGLESQWTRKDGKKIWIRENVQLVKDDQSGTHCYEGTLEDITHQKELEIIFKKQRDILNVAQQLAHMGSWEENLKTGAIIWSDAEYELFELPIGTKLTEELFLSRIHPADRPILKRRRQDCINNRKYARELEYRLISGNKSKWVRSIIELRRDKQGKVESLYGVDKDITAEKERSIQLEQEHYMLQKTQQLGKIGSWELDVKTKTVQISDEALRLYGLPRKEMYHLDDFIGRIHPDDRKRRALSPENVANLKKGTFNSSYRLLVNGEVKWINAIGEVIANKKDKPVKVVAAVQDVTEKKNTELVKQQLEHEKAAIFSAIPDMIFVLSREGVYLDYMAGVNTKPYVSPDLFLGKKITEVLPANVSARHMGLLHMAFATGKIQRAEYQLNIDGVAHYYEARISPIDTGKAVVVVRDVSMREKSRLEILRINDELRLFSKAMEDSPLSILITDADCHIEYVNRYFTKHTGYTKEEVLGENPRILKSGHHGEEFYRQLWETIRSGKTWRGEILNKKKNGELYWESSSISPIYNQQKQIAHFVNIKEDITQKHKDREAIDKLALLIETSEAIIIGKSLDGIIESWNRGAEIAYGYKAEEVIGLPISIIVPNELKNKLTRFSTAIKAGKRIDRFETKRIRKDGTLVEVSLNFSGIKDMEGNIVGVSIVGQDVTKQKQLERELIAAKEKAEEATQSKSIFLANMSHEIRTPLNAILGFSEILSKRISNPVEKEYVQSMNLSGKALLNLINDLLDFSKMEAGKLELHAHVVDVRYLVHDMESIFRLKARQKQLDFVVNIEDDVPPNLVLDELKVRQVLLNLTSNAIKFTEKGFVKINVRVEKVRKQVVDLIMEVQDSGKGIPAEYHQKIFKLFEQQDNAISKQYGGTGLGLAISHQIVSLMGGHIDLKSEVGKGSLFKVRLPDISLGSEMQKTAELIPLLKEEVNFEPATILLVDDTPNNREVLKAFFEDYPFKVLEAENGQKALQILENNKVDLVLMDIRMPVMGGIDATQKIREYQEWSHIPVIALTASATEFEGSQLLNTGFNDYIRKPAALDEVILVLSRFLKTKPNGHHPALKPLSPENIKHFPELVKKLETDIFPLYQSLSKIRPRSRVKAFAKALIALGEAHESESIENYGHDLLIAGENFLLEKEKELLDNFANFVKQIKDQNNDSGSK